jgi:DNA-binding MarR family transcriptional regulator
MNLPEVVSWKAILFAQRAVYSKLESALFREGCSITRFQVLLILYFEGPQSAADFVKRLLLSRGNISMLLKRIAKDHLIEFYRKTSKTTSRPLYNLTKQGRDEFERLFPNHIERVTALVPKLDPTTLTKLQEIEKKTTQ